MKTEAIPVFITLLGTAFLGSWHCAAMCGPIAASLTQRKNLYPYHLGRGCAYLILGALAGSIGSSILASHILPLKWIAAVLLSSVFIGQLFQWKSANVLIGTSKIYASIAKRRPNAFGLGFTTILLPCGWLWTFVAAAAATGSSFAAILVMSILWLSSLAPLTFVQMYFRSSLKNARPAQSRWIPVALSIAGLYAVWGHYL